MNKFIRYYMVFIELFLLFALFILLGCANHYKQRMYFAAVDLDEENPTIKFYRMTMNAKARNMISTLQAGYYNANDVRSLYGEVKPPTTSANSPKISNRYQLYYKNGRWEMVDPDFLYTIVYGGDSKAIVNVIKTIGQSDDLGNTLGSLLLSTQGSENVKKKNEADKEAEIIKKRKQQLADHLDAIADDVSKTTNMTPLQLRLLLLKATQEISNSLGSTQTFEPTDPDKGFEGVSSILSELKK